MIHGKIQGLMLRTQARTLAKHLELTGFAKNFPDGSIYIEVEGEEKPLTEFLAWCHKGPKHAQIDKIEIIPHPVRHYSVFRLVGD